MTNSDSKDQANLSPQRKAAERLLTDLKRTLEIEAGRGNITIGHFLSARNSGDSEALAPQTQEGTGFYTLQKVVATGGMGAVLMAQDNNLARTVALKVMLNSAEANDEAVFSFVAEAQITGQLEHPNIVPLHDIGVAADGTIYYTMKLIEGRTLRDILKDIRDGNADTIKRYPIGKLLTVFQKVCDGISYAHSRGVIHRDLKPDNVMVGAYGEVLILDWGLAKVLPEPGQAATEEPGGEFSGPLPGAAGTDWMATMTGQVKGTPNYMAPEQAEGRVDIDTRSDIYALGGILYFILTMRPPVTGTNLDEVLKRVISGDIASPSSFNSKTTENPTAGPVPHCPDGLIPEALSAVAMKCLARERERRYQTGEELQSDIAAYQAGYATRAQQANFLTLMRLMFQRNKKEVFIAGFGVLAVIFTGLAFLGKVKLSEIKARDALKEAKLKVEELRQTAPSFAVVAQAELRKLNFTNALANVDQAIKLDGTNADFHNIKGDILMSQLQIVDARKAYEKGQEHGSSNSSAARSSGVCAVILRDNPDPANLSEKSKRDVYELFREQGRVEEADRIFTMIAATDTQILVGLRRQLANAGIKPELLERDSAGRYSLDLSETPVNDLRSLANIPIASLSLAGSTNITDLSPLKGMPLTTLDLSGLANLNNLVPLRGMQLTALNLKGCAKVLDLAPLAGMPLTHLDLTDTGIYGDLAPLAGVPLRWVNLERTKVINLGPLAGAPLQFLNINNTRVREVAPLAGMPLTTNLMSQTSVRELTALKGMRLQHLTCSKTPVQDLTPLLGMTSLRLLDLREAGITNLAPLAGMPLDVLKLADTQITDIAALRGAPLTVELDLTGTQVTSLEPLRGAALQNLNLSKVPVTSLAGLAGMPLKVLRIDSLPTQPDLNPLWECQNLEQLAIPFPSPSVVALRQLPKLKRLDYYVPDDNWARAKTPSQFWKDWDARNR